MKYINREYGFSGRPPLFNDYYEMTAKGPIITPDCYPIKNFIGAGLDIKEPYGAMLIGENGSRWGIKISCNIRGRWLDSDNYIKEIGRLYAVSPDGNFTYFAYGDMTATLVKYSRKALVMSIATIDNIKLRLTFYLQRPCEGEIRAVDNIVKGASNYHATVAGNAALVDRQSVFRDRYEVVGDGRNKEYFTAKVYKNPVEIIKGDNYITYEYDLQGKDSRLFVYVAIGDKGIFSEYPEESELVEGTSMEEIVYSTNKTIGRGLLGRSANGFLNSSMFHRVYNPFIKGYMYIESRLKTDEFFAYNGTDLSIASIIASYIGDYDTAKSQIELNFDDEILAPLALWQVYSRTRDKELLKNIFKDYSRKYIPKGDLVISEDKSEIAYGMEGSPLKELNINKPMYSLDKSCTNLLAMDILERISLIVGAPENSLYAAAKERLKALINDTLWNPKLGIYMNRYVSGEFAAAVGITSFYPLVAGAVDGLDKLEKLVAYLRNNKKFYGEKMIPTLSKDHPEYGIKFTDAKGEMIEAYQGYRGMIVPYMNYLVYLGLIRYGVYDLAGEIALKSANMWNRRYRKGNYEVLNYYLPDRVVKIDRVTLKADAEKILKNAERHSLSGNLMALMGLSELLDIEYFRDDLKIALKFGTLVKGEHSLSRINLLGRQFSINIDDRGLDLTVDGVNVVKGSGGKFIVRQFIENIKGCQFIILSENDITVELKLPILGVCKDMTAMTFTVESGLNKVIIKNGRIKIEKIY